MKCLIGFIVLIGNIMVSNAMQLSAHNYEIQPWPTQQADRFQEKINSLGKIKRRKDSLLSGSVYKLMRAGKKGNLDAVKESCKEIEKYEDAIALSSRVFTRQEILTAAFDECTIPKSMASAYYLLNQPGGIYPHIYMNGRHGIVHAILASTNGWNNEACVEFLNICERVGIPFNVANPKKLLPLHIAAAYRSVEVIKKVCKNPQWINVKDVDGKTVLDYAAHNAYYEGVRNNLALDYLKILSDGIKVPQATRLQIEIQADK